MSDFLEQMAEASRERADAIDPAVADGPFEHRVVPLRPGTFDVIAEIKGRSPAEGDLGGETIDHVGRARRYAAGGAAAISVLTEPSRFAGSLAHLEAVAGAVPGTPVMRKDFLVSPLQVHEARMAGASGVLLIVAMLDDDALDDMLDTARGHRMFVLLEAFDEPDLERIGRLLEEAQHRDAATGGRLLVGVNTRNLRTLEVDGDRLAALAPLLPLSATCVAESGLQDADAALAAARAGYRMALVGTALMKSADPTLLIRAMRSAGASGLAA